MKNKVINVCRDGVPSACGLRDGPSCHGRGGHGDALRVRDVPYGHGGPHRDDAYRGARGGHGVPRGGRSGDDRPSCGRLRDVRGVRDGGRVCGACLHGGGRHGSGGPCGSDPCGTSCGIHRYVHPYHGAPCGRASLPYGGARLRGGDHGGRARPNASCVRRRARGGVPHGGVCHGGHGLPCGGDDVLCDPCVRGHRVRGGDGHDVRGRRHAHGDGLCRLQPRLGPPPRERRMPLLGRLLLALTNPSCL